MFDNNLRIWEYENLNKIEASLTHFFCQICTVCNQWLGQLHIHVNFVIGWDITVYRFGNANQNIDHDWDAYPESRCAKHRLVQSMVDPRYTKPNKHFLLIFGQFFTSMCTCLQSNPGILWIVRVFTTDTICTDWILVPLVTITTMCNAEYQSKYNLQYCCTSFTVVSTTGNVYTWPLKLLLFFAHFSVNTWYPDLVFWRKPFKKDYLSFYQSIFFFF